jgi:2,3-bisphosphoglycerate-dependent phosphoglycerate mutase
MPSQLVLLRHGQSTWNLENRFTGWQDVDLSEQGRLEAERAGLLLAEEGFQFDHAYTSVLKRAIRTLWIALDVMDQMWVPVTRAWVLNERHYGALTGLDKKETMERHGADQVQEWRRGFAVRPPPMTDDDPRHPRFDPRYRGLEEEQRPATESLADTCARVIPYWESTLRPEVAAGQSLLVVAHGNSLRALVKHLDGLSEDVITGLNIPTGFPLIYTFDDEMRVLGHRYLGDPAEVEAAIKGVANQTKKD